MPGVASAAGCSADEFWSAVTGGAQDGLVKVKTVSGKEFFAGKIADKKLSPTAARFDMRIIQIEDLALNQISSQIEFCKNKYGPSRVGVFVGSCDNGSEFSVAGHRKYFESGAFGKDYSIEMQSADYPATYIKEKYGLEGPAYVFATACSSSATAVIKAAQMIRAGMIDAAVVGGADLASDTALIGFDALESISKEKTNPFSKNRSGITLGEGAAFFVLCKEPPRFFAGTQNDGGDDAPCHVERGETSAAIELLGYGESSDANHITAPLADGTGAAAAMNAALRFFAGTQNDNACAQNDGGDDDASCHVERSETSADSSVAPLPQNDKACIIDYINLHGTGTHLNDAMEARGVNLVFKDAAALIPCSSTKPLTGHTLGASSAIELAACYLAIVHNELPLHVFDGEYDEGLPKLNLVRYKNQSTKKIKVCMSNSFGFGGCNTSLIIGKRG